MVVAAAVIATIAVIVIAVIIIIVSTKPTMPAPQSTSGSIMGTANKLPKVKQERLKGIKLAVIVIATPEISDYANYTIEVNKAWAEKMGYGFFVFVDNETPDLPINFSKIKAATDVLEKEAYTHVMHIDADAIVTNMSYDARNIVAMYPASDFIVGEDCYSDEACSKPGKLNSGVWIASRNATDILGAWLHAARTECGEALVNVFPNCQLVFSKCVADKFKDRIAIIPFNIMNGYGDTLFIKHVMAKDRMERVDEIKQLYACVKARFPDLFGDPFSRVRVWA